MTKLERKAALAVAAATVGVIVSGVALLRKHGKYMAKKAAATFGEDDGDDFTEVGSAGENGSFGESAVDDSADAKAIEDAKHRKLMRLRRQHQVKMTRLQERKLMRLNQLQQKKMMKVK